MKRPVKMLVSFVLACLLSAAWAPISLAAEKNLPDSFLIDDENGISVTDAGEYFLYSHNLMPGDVITRTLTLRNLEQGEPFRLHMLGESPESAGPVDWLDNLHLQITLDGRALYAGRLRGDGKDTRTMEGNGVDLIGKGLDLGTFKKGDYGVLEFTVTADAGHLSAEDLYESSSAKISWVFYGLKDAPPDDVKTGDNLRRGMYVLLLLLGFLCAVFYIRYRKALRV